MSKGERSVMEPVKKRYYLVIAAVFLIIIGLILIYRQNRHKELEDKLLLHMFGKQKMYTQMMSKDTNRMYSLLLSFETDQYQEKDNISIEEIKESLHQAKESFGQNLEAIHSKRLTMDSYEIHIHDTIICDSLYLKELDALWEEFAAAIDVMLAAKEVDSEVVKATNYINANNIELFNLCNGLLEQLLENALRFDRTMVFVIYGLIGALILVILILLYQQQHYMLKPFGVLYKGIADIGLDNYPKDSHYYPTKKKIMPIVSEINDMFLKIEDLISLIENINTNASFMDTLNFINKTFSNYIPYNYIGIALISEDKKILKASYGVSDGSIIGLPERIKGIACPIEETSLEKLFHTGEVRIINDLEAYNQGKPPKLYNSIIMEAGIRASITLPLKMAGEPMGVIFFSSRNKNVYTEKHLNFLNTLANSIAICLNQNILVSEILYSSILALAKLAEARDEDTGEHMDRMSVYSGVIAQLLYDKGIYTDEITLEYIEKIERYSPLHDIGKVGVPDGILLKPGKLTAEEFEDMKKHTTFGADVLKSAEKNMQMKGKQLFTMGIEIAEGHHEKWDGSGYPFGKKGKDIPLCARIVAVADVFDALTSKRPYKEAFPFDMAMNIIEEGRGKHFDPVIADVFLENRDVIKELYHKLKANQKSELTKVS